MMLLEFQLKLSLQLRDLEQKQLLVACSGGVDSMVLVDLLLRAGKKPCLAHVNFQLRGKESDVDEAFVEEFAKANGLKYFTKRCQTKSYANKHGISIQMAARELRYDWFAELMEQEGCNVLLTAHHLDDSLETFMINLSRGTGVKGLLGIPPLKAHLLRPMSSFTKEQILQYAAEHDVQWREDSSNLESDYQRNALRHEVIPQWKEVQPNLLKGFRTTLRNLDATNTLLEDYIARLHQDLFTYSDGDILIDVEELRTVSNHELVLYYLFNPYGFRNGGEIELLLGGQTGKWISSGDFKLLKDRDRLILTKHTIESDSAYLWDSDKEPFQGPISLRFSAVEKVDHCSSDSIVVDRDTLEFPLQVRRWQEGDRFFPFGMKGSKKLSKYFKDEKLSLVDKQRVWLLCSEGEIVWIIGHRMDDRFKVQQHTRRMARIDNITPHL